MIKLLIVEDFPILTEGLIRIFKAIPEIEIMGITDLLDRRPFNLSGGQMRKVAIAGILASNPDVLILDEPTAGLDPLAKSEFLDFLKTVNEEYHKSIIIITHDMDVVSKYLKRVLVLKQGELMFDGSKDDLFRNEEIIRDCNLDYPEIVKVLKKLKTKLDVKLDEYQYNVNDAFKEVERVIGTNK